MNNADIIKTLAQEDQDVLATLPPTAPNYWAAYERFLNAKAAATVRTPKFHKDLARRKKAARRWHLTHEA